MKEKENREWRVKLQDLLSTSFNFSFSSFFSPDKVRSFSSPHWFALPFIRLFSPFFIFFLSFLLNQSSFKLNLLFLLSRRHHSGLVTMSDDVASLFGGPSTHASTGDSFFDPFSQQPVSTSSQQAPNQPYQQYQQHQQNPQLHVETHLQAQHHDSYQQQQYEGHTEQTAAGSETQADSSQNFAPDYYTYASYYQQDPNLQETHDLYLQWCAAYYPGLPKQQYGTSAGTYDQQYSQQQDYSQQAPTVAVANESLVAGDQGAGHYEGQGQAPVGSEPHTSWEAPAPQTAFVQQDQPQQQQQQQYSDHNRGYNNAFQQDPKSFFDTLTPHDPKPTTTANPSDAFGGHDQLENGAASVNEDDDSFRLNAAPKSLSSEHLDAISGEISSVSSSFCSF